MGTITNQPALVDLPRIARKVAASAASNATETTAGSIELATQAETDAGTDDFRAVTPLKLEAANLGGFQSVQIFPADGTYTKPAGLARALVEVVSAGGGGGGTASTGAGTQAAAGGGGAGGYAKELLEASAIGTTEVTTVGALGAGGTAGANIGSAGGASSFGSLLSATGGSGGLGSSDDVENNGAAAGIGSGGDINGGGSDGEAGIADRDFDRAVGGSGGSLPPFGGGGRGSYQTEGDAASGKGAGGAGASAGPSESAKAGGDGTAGIIIVWEYF